MVDIIRLSDKDGRKILADIRKIKNIEVAEAAISYTLRKGTGNPSIK